MIGKIFSFFRGILFQPLVLLILLVVALGAAGYSYNLYRGAQAELKRYQEDPRAVAEEEVKRVVGEVGKLVALPEGEDPTVATVTDPENLKSQPFFEKAENGDKVLIYTQAKRAILYRPSSKKVIEVAPINIGNQQGLEGGEAQAVPRIAFYNGTNQSGLTRDVENKLKSELEDTNFEVTTRENASFQDYSSTIVVDVSGKFGTLVARVASVLGAEIASIPDGEKTPSGSDILVIAGGE
jgi:hypothetical protein